METSQLRKRTPVTSLTDPKIVWPAIGSAFAKLDPRLMMKNPVMFVVEVVAALTTVIFIRDWVNGGDHLRLHLPNHRLAVVHRPVRQFRRSRGRGPRQGASRNVCVRLARRPMAKLIVDEKTGLSCRRRQASLARVRSCWSKRAT